MVWPADIDEGKSGAVIVGNDDYKDHNLWPGLEPIWYLYNTKSGLGKFLRNRIKLKN